jgi:transcriptional regulator with XRE-family HTH domain
MIKINIPIHMGVIIRKELARRNLTLQEFGDMINLSAEAVKGLLRHKSIKIEKLIAISAALDRDFIGIYYLLEPMKSLKERNERAKRAFERLKGYSGDNLDVLKFIKQLDEIYHVINSDIIHEEIPTKKNL